MLWSAETLKSFDCEAAGQRLGRISQFYFDEQNWAVRFLVIDAGTWLAARNLLVPPDAIDTVAAEKHTLYLHATAQALAQQTPACLLTPQSAIAQAVEYGMPLLWSCEAIRPTRPYAETSAQTCGAEIAAATDAAHLQSTEEISGYRVHAAHGLLGHIVDFLLEVPPWRLRYLVISVHQWRPGKKILLPACQVQRIAWAPAWAEREIQTDLPRQAVMDAPAYHPGDVVETGQPEMYYARASQAVLSRQDKPTAAPG